jgi:hypothetical protein
MTKVVSFLVFALIAFGVYVRLAPTSVARWHGPVEGEDAVFAGGVRKVIPGQSGQLSALVAIIEQEPRTRLIAGSLAEGRLTFVTRSRLWGFPDYATVEARGVDLVIYARLRFGRSDLGVNSARVARWIGGL